MLDGTVEFGRVLTHIVAEFRGIRSQVSKFETWAAREIPHGRGLPVGMVAREAALNIV